MASTANIASNLTPSAGVSGVIPGQKDAPNKSTVKTAGGVKMNERGRKESPVDLGRRPQQKVWSSSTNPVVQRSAALPQPNGSSMQSKNVTSSKPALQRETGLSDKHGHDRLRFILAATVGLTVVFTTKAGDKFEGILAGSATSNNSTRISLKMTRKIQNNVHQTNGVAAREAALVGASPEYAMIFDFKDMADLMIPEFTLPEASRHVNGGTASFQTDSDISGNTVRGQRPLQKWEPDGPEGIDFSLESTPTGQWDQFETHNQMFGDKSTYDENLYTTEINRKAPGYKQREAEAARIAREIEGTTSTNPHVREERNQASEQDFGDEEDKYSGVRREGKSEPTLAVGGPNKYTPPARRPPTALPTVAGAPVDSAIISAQLSKPDSSKSTRPKSPFEKPVLQPAATTSQTDSGTHAHNNANQDIAVATEAPTAPTATSTTKLPDINTSLLPPSKSNDNPTENVENKVLNHFKQFANAERALHAERKRVQASQDRTAKLNDLLRFSKTFKLKTPVPTDLVGILAKDPAKQEAIIEKAQKDHEEAKSATVPVTAVPSTAPNAPANSASSGKAALVPKFDASQIPPPIPDRNTFNRGRGAYAPSTTRGERGPQQNVQFPGRNSAAYASRSGGFQDRKMQVPAPIPLPEGRTPPLGPAADQSNLASPQRSAVQTPTSAVSTRMNAKAMEFRPTAAPFNPPATSNTPSSPASVQRAGSLSRTASPSSFFGTHKPKLPADRMSVSSNFNPLKRMRQEIKDRKLSDKSDEPVKDYAFNGGIPNAYHTGPVWQVKEENKDKTYLTSFERPGVSISPAQTRATSAHTLSFQGQVPLGANGTLPQVPTHQHSPHTTHHYGHQFDDHRLHVLSASPQVFASPGMASRQMSNFSPHMPHQTQLAYGNTSNQIQMPMRQYPNTPGMMHAQPGQMAAPMMVQQASNGPYMTVPQNYNQMQMYSPSPAHVYPQQNGYPSPGRVAPMMMQQGSQQGHHNGQQVMYAMPGQGGPVMYGHAGQVGMIRGGYGGPQGPYGSSPHQPHHLQQRAMSSGYGQKGMPQTMQQTMQQTQGPPSNAPQQPAAYAQMDVGSEDAK